MLPRLKILIGALLLALTLPGNAAAASMEKEITAASAVLMDRDTGRVLWEKNARQKRPIASVTKIMTAILALEMGNLLDTVIVSKHAANTEGSSIWLEEGEKKTLEELLYGLMLCSGNDAAVAIAEHLAGSVENFARLMNEKAKAIGAVDTSFVNPHGLHHEDHYSTAYDMALISCYALHNSCFREIITTAERSITWPGQPWDRALVNQNRLLELYPQGDGIKTGWTDAAGRCFAGSATRDQWQLVAVVLNAPQMWEDTMRLLDYGFNTYCREKVLCRGQELLTASVTKGERRQVRVVCGSDVCAPLLPGEEQKIHFRFFLEEEYTAPLCAGDKLGRVEIFLEEQLLATGELQASVSVPKLSPGRLFLRLLTFM